MSDEITNTPSKPITKYFGIRHHGPGSASRLLASLDALQPKKILIEGPADCSEMIANLAHRQMRPPVALLSYASDMPNCHVYYPFSEFSPEYQACLWAVENGAELAFVDVPVDIKLAQQVAEAKAFEEQMKLLEAQAEDAENSPEEDDADDTLESKDTENSNEENAEQDADNENIEEVDNEASNPETPNKQNDKLTLSQLSRDPIGVLASLAGYEDGEAWWHDLIESTVASTSHDADGNEEDNEKDSKQNNELDIFASVATAMTVLREKQLELADVNSTEDNSEHDVALSHQTQKEAQDELENQQREAYMRLQIAKESKDVEGNIAVVCGAWHIPALDPSIYKTLDWKSYGALSNQGSGKITAKADRAIIKTLPKKLPASKVKSTWVPWTSPRLATQSGYGAGVRAPMWYLHLWQQRNNPQALEHWVSKIARSLRKSGQVVSTASVIEAVRLSTSIAAVRSRPSVGFEEITEAVIACLCFGEQLIWQQVADNLLLGNQVGSIPEDTPLAPLLEDLQRQQKKLKLKPEALQRELSLDLRSQAGLGKSILLHRLQALDVPWGEMTDTGSSRGTFRERWILAWEPEYAVRLVENLVYGNTIEQASNNKLSEAMRAETNLGKLAETVQLCLEAQLTQATDEGLHRISDRAAQTDNAIELLDSLAPLIHIERYGTARDMSLDQVAELINQLSIKAALALPYACRNLNDDESHQYRHSISTAHAAILLAELEDDLMHNWWEALHTIIDNLHSSLLVSGLCARLLYQDKEISEDNLAELLQRALSPAIPASDAARFFEGFFADATERLLYDNMLLSTVERWLLSLSEDDFVEFLPLFRRVFSDLDATERRRLIDTVLNSRTQGNITKVVNTDMLPHWQTHLARMGQLIQRDIAWID